MLYAPLTVYRISGMLYYYNTLEQYFKKKIRFPENFSGKYDLAEWILVDDDDDDDDLLYRSNATVRK